jgi:hypothetical protein
MPSLATERSDDGNPSGTTEAALDLSSLTLAMTEGRTQARSILPNVKEKSMKHGLLVGHGLGAGEGACFEQQRCTWNPDQVRMTVETAEVSRSLIKSQGRQVRADRVVLSLTPRPAGCGQ